ncbi:class A beta-lactamase [Paenibacillus jiagnxiensis]|uniref:class A beta-lactamase n=1 Tax=Paenibacillus jiagnxiensis TaxID=3228926 RepID=UPI0038D45A84
MNKKALCASVLCLVLLVGCTKTGAVNPSADTVSQSAGASNPAPEKDTSNELNSAFEQLESKFEARLGVYALDTGTGKEIAYRGDERFAYASTFKALAAGSILRQASGNDLDKVIKYSKDDLVTYSPITEQHVDTGMTLSEICDAALRFSDNTAGNLLLKELGGPEGFEKAMREIGDTVIMPERYETELNEAVPGDTRDTSTPKALVQSLKVLAVDDSMPADKQELLINWMKGNTTGDELIRAGVPEGWEVGDKTGAASYGTRNDLAIVWPPDREPIIIAVLSSRDTQDAKYDNELIAQAAKTALEALK